MKGKILELWTAFRDSFIAFRDNKSNHFFLYAAGLFALAGLLIIIILPAVLSQCTSLVDYTNSGQIGDTIGGISGPWIALIAAFLTFIAFLVQYQANVKQAEQFNNQDKDTKIQRFENKFYELLRLHKENLHEIKIGRGDNIVEERKAFVSMFHEFKYTFFVTQNIYNDMRQRNALNETYTDERLVRLAYIFFYSGVGDNSDLMSAAMNVAEPNHFNDALFEEVHTNLVALKKMQAPQRPVYQDADGNNIKTNRGYTPWDGHQSRLGHYYRHLFQTVKYIATQNENFIPRVNKMEYLRTVRAQLSDHEQLLLYYNALADFGGAWIQDERNNNVNYFTEYHMIHNIPIPLANFGIRPEVKFQAELQNDPSLFEWLEE